MNKGKVVYYLTPFVLHHDRVRDGTGNDKEKPISIVKMVCPTIHNARMTKCKPL